METQKNSAIIISIVKVNYQIIFECDYELLKEMGRLGLLRYLEDNAWLIRTSNENDFKKALKALES